MPPFSRVDYQRALNGHRLILICGFGRDLRGDLEEREREVVLPRRCTPATETGGGCRMPAVSRQVQDLRRTREGRIVEIRYKRLGEESITGFNGSMWTTLFHDCGPCIRVSIST